MGIESFNYIQPSVANGEHVKLAHTIAGDPVQGSAKTQAESVGENVQLAGLFSTAPYRPRKISDPTRNTALREPGREGKCSGNDDTCNAYATRKYPGLCAFHGMAKYRGV